MEKLKLQPGMSLPEVETTSGVRLNLAGLRDNSPLVIEKPVQIGFYGPRGAFDLPPTLMAWINQHGGTIVNCTWAPQLEAIDLVAVRALALQTVATIERAGWQAESEVQRSVPSVLELEDQFSNRRTRSRFSRSLGEWRLDGTSLSLSLREVLIDGADSTAPLSKRRFLLNLFLSNRTVENEQYDAMIARRRAMGGGDNDALPLSAWIGPR